MQMRLYLSVSLAATLLCALCYPTAARVSTAPWLSVASFDRAFPLVTGCELLRLNTSSHDETDGSSTAAASTGLPVLLYFTIAGSEEYESMLRLLLITLRPLLSCWQRNMRVLVISAQPSANRVVQILEEVLPRGAEAIVHVLETPDVFRSAVNKLSVTDIPDLALLQQVDGGDAVPAFDRVVYMDVDMLVLPPAPAASNCTAEESGNPTSSCSASPPTLGDWPLQKLLRMPLQQDVLYAPGELQYDVDNEYFSLHRYTEEELRAFRSEEAAGAVSAVIDAGGAAQLHAQTPASLLQQKQQQPSQLRSGVGRPGDGVLRPRKPFNTGFFMFRPSAGIVDALRAAFTDAITTPVEARPPYCMEQPYMNYHLHTRDAVDWLALQPHIVTDSKLTPRDGDPLWRGAAVVHITGLSGTNERLHQRKLARAQALFTRLLAQVPREELLG